MRLELLLGENFLLVVTVGVSSSRVLHGGLIALPLSISLACSCAVAGLRRGEVVTSYTLPAPWLAVHAEAGLLWRLGGR